MPHAETSFLLFPPPPTFLPLPSFFPVLSLPSFLPTLLLSLPPINFLLGPLSAVDRWLSQMGQNTHPATSSGPQGNLELVDYLYQNIDGIKYPRNLNSGSSKDLKDLSKSSLPVSPVGNSGSIDKQNNGRQGSFVDSASQNSDPLRVFAVVYERKGNSALSALFYIRVSCRLTFLVLLFLFLCCCQ
jgi:hypothetical protein